MNERIDWPIQNVGAINSESKTGFSRMLFFVISGSIVFFFYIYIGGEPFD